ncbi:hypothetical protein TrST_g4112 [Triparma strigata]|uniref:EML-like first beta-propeller domain-containing protein n=1 Tax=Triparma strigata TaxID=1606541 RepID=A0A9W7EDD1_9STRA|nr:hypothetical protein TrST_g4112 [Triparma strigata]
MSESYQPSSFLPRRDPHELPRTISALHSLAGFPIDRRQNIYLVDSNTMLYIAGNELVQLDLTTKKRTYVKGLDNKAIGCFAVSPAGDMIALGCVGTKPNVYIYDFPSFALQKILKTGTERGYASMSFTADGEKLSTVGMKPDFLLTVWDWKNERITLHTKAFGQDVYKVAFSQDDPGRLTTSGTGHIRFWNMTKTFTGLKLQGEIGKFGKIDLSDIEDFVELPDGKVISSSESGYLLLWEGNFVKCRFVTSSAKPELMYDAKHTAGNDMIFGDVPAHKGGIFCLKYDRKRNMIVTSGGDGTIKYWSFPEIDVAEVDSDITMDYPIEPKTTVTVSPDASVKYFIESPGEDNTFLIEDGNGALYRQPCDGSAPSEKLWEFHAGPVAGVAASPVDHFCVTGGKDGKVFCWDYVTKTVVSSVKNAHGCTSVTAAPTTVDKDGRTFAAGFEDGVVRCYVRTNDELTLQQVMKPHTEAVSRVEYSPDGKYIATGGVDGLVFVLKCPAKDSPTSPYTPVGFVTSEDSGPIVSLSWRADSKALLYGTGNTLTEIDVSEELASVSANSFEMKPKTRTYQYKDRPVIKETNPEDEEKKNADDIEEEEPPEPVPPSITFACYKKTAGEEENFVVGFGDEKAGKLIEGKFGDEYSLGEYFAGVQIENLLEDEEISKVKSLTFSSSQNFFLGTNDDGSVTVRPSAELGYFTKYSNHDPNSGGCSGAALSFDDEFLLSVGDDGVLAIYRLNPKAVEAAAMEAKEKRMLLDEGNADKLLSSADSGEGSSVPPEGFDEIFASTKEGQDKAAAAAAAAVEDITDDTAYSIQDEKLRKEEDARKAAAERKKEGVREKIVSMQKEFAEFVKKNSALPAEQRLTPEELTVDPEFNQILIEAGRQMIKEVELECAHESEKTDVRLKKLREEFLEVLDYERFTVHSLKAKSLQVSSFPTLKYPDVLVNMLDHVHNVMKGEETSSLRSRSHHSSSDRSVRSTRNTNRSTKSKVAIDMAALGLSPDGSPKKLSAFETRKLMRMERKHAMEELVERKPAEDADDPRDVKAIADAIANLGDYKVKTGEDYEVPEEQQVNAEKKRRQMVLLEESIHNIKVNFNESLLGARDMKARVVLATKSSNARMRAIDKQLEQQSMSKDLWDPELQPSEYPEDREVFVESDYEKFKESVKTNDGKIEDAKCPVKSVCKKAIEGGSADQASGGKGGAIWSPEAVALAQTLPILKASYSHSSFGEMPEVQDPSSLSQIEKDEISEIKKKLKHERQSIVAKIASDVKEVDTTIGELRKERLVLSVELKAAEMRLLVLFKELHLLQEFESKDKMLSTKLEKCQRDKAEVVANISDCFGRLQTKSAELEVWVEKDDLIMGEFLKVVPESNAFCDQLLKIFKRKIKRAKKRSTGDEDEDEDEDEESDYDDYDEDDEDEDDEEVDDSCPPGCDTHLYESIIEMREKRLDQEEYMSEFQKELDALKKTHDRHVGRERQIDKDLKSTEIEIQKFQTEKQKEINELLVTIPLKVGQIRLWKPEVGAEGEMVEVPSDPTILRESVKINECTIFSEDDLGKIRNRIGELKDEIVVDKGNFSGLHKEKRALEKDKLVKEKKIEKQAKECEEIQMLKFGQLVDIEALDKISVNNDEAELKSKSNELEITNEKEIFALQAKHRRLKEKLLDSTNVNTGKLNNIAELNGRQFFLEKELNGKGGGMQVADDGPTIREETEERNRLVALVKLQAKEVDALKAEINLLRRKGGHIYAPPPPPEGGSVAPAMEGSVEGGAMSLGGVEGAGM